MDLDIFPEPGLTEILDWKDYCKLLHKFYVFSAVVLEKNIYIAVKDLQRLQYLGVMVSWPLALLYFDLVSQLILIVRIWPAPDRAELATIHTISHLLGEDGEGEGHSPTQD